MKVYVVVGVSGGEPDVYGVFTTKGEAKKCQMDIDRVPYGGYCIIMEQEVLEKNTIEAPRTVMVHATGCFSFGEPAVYGISYEPIETETTVSIEESTDFDYSHSYNISFTMNINGAHRNHIYSKAYRMAHELFDGYLKDH